VLFVPIVTAMVAVALVTSGATVRRRLCSRRFIFSPLVALVVLAPWFIREQITFGDALIGLKRSSTQLLVYLPRVSMPWHFYLSGLPEMLSLVVVFFGLGIVWAAWRRDRFGLHCFAVAAGILVWFSCYRYKETRLVTSVLPFVAIVAALGVTRLLATPSVRRSVVIPAAIAAVFGLSFFETRATFTHSVTAGYPAFYVAMQFVRTYASVKGVVVGANYPQISWYADRQAIDFPPTEAELKTMLERVEWVIVTDFERGQQPWVAPLVKKLSRQDVRDGNVMEFRDERFVTYVIRADLLQKRL
jgi:Alg9-like mannosyltransferase family